eukprot:CCRYP_005553-RE/>CCRYP_005553-RE protein AED:0.47 eAED:0.61 QI:0/0/0/1/0/0/2/0/111
MSTALRNDFSSIDLPFLLLLRMVSMIDFMIDAKEASEDSVLVPMVLFRLRGSRLEKALYERCRDGLLGPQSICDNIMIAMREAMRLMERMVERSTFIQPLFHYIKVFFHQL